MSDNEPYGVKGARIILVFKNLNGEEQNVGSFNLDPNTVSTMNFVIFKILIQLGIYVWRETKFY